MDDCEAESMADCLVASKGMMSAVAPAAYLAAKTVLDWDESKAALTAAMMVANLALIVVAATVDL